MIFTINCNSCGVHCTIFELHTISMLYEYAPLTGLVGKLVLFVETWNVIGKFSAFVATLQYSAFGTPHWYFVDDFKDCCYGFGNSVDL